MNIELVMTAPAKSWFELVVTLFVGTAWPLLIGVAVFTFRKDLSVLFEVLAKQLSDVRRLKIGAFEVGEILTAAEQKAKESASKNPAPKDVPLDQIETSQQVDRQLSNTSLAAEDRLSFVRRRLASLAGDYEVLRLNVNASPERTARMNEIVSLMRIFAVPAQPLLPELTRSGLVGERLAALAILQIKSYRKYIPWLRARFDVEQQAFVLYHTALVLLRMSRIPLFARDSKLKHAINHGLVKVKAFDLGAPDQNTIDTLEDALQIIEHDAAS